MEFEILRDSPFFADDFTATVIDDISPITLSGFTFLAVAGGVAMIETGYILCAGMFACLPADTVLHLREARLMLVTLRRFEGIPLVGGPVERTGRLDYIDGCSDTGLIAPLRLGNPCLNFLHFPPGVRQTRHTHPSHRIGLVYRGNGVCIHDNGETPMRAGDVFALPAWTPHCFHTAEDIMDIIAFHPDSVFGPTDESHQMKNATIQNAA